MAIDILGQYIPPTYKLENKSLGVSLHGDSNLRSLINENLIDKSGTASYCAGLYSKFISGAGFTGGDVNISDKTHKIVTPNLILRSCAIDHSKNEGSFVHVRYNALYQKVGFQKFPFSQCRFGLSDDNDYRGKIVRSKKGWGRGSRNFKDDFETYDVYNPDPEVIQKQVDLAGGWKHYKGQVMFIAKDSDSVYPKSRIEGVENFAHTEHKMGQFYASTVERGFENVQVFEYVEHEDDRSNRALKEGVQNSMGLDNSGKVIALSYAQNSSLKDDSRYKFTALENNSTPDKYDHFLDRSSQMIRSKWEVPTQLFEAVSGKLGNTNGEDLKTAQAMYSQTTAPERMLYSNSFRELFNNYKTPLEIDWNINQYSLISEDGTIEDARPTNK